MSEQSADTKSRLPFDPSAGRAGISNDSAPSWLLENVAEAVIQFSSDWRYLYLNHAAERMLRRKRADLIGKMAWDEHPELVGTAFYNSCLAAQREGREIVSEEFYAPLSKRFRLRTVPDPATGVITCLMREVTPERKRSTEHLLDAGLVGILHWTINGGIVDANDTFLQMLGYTRDDLLAGRIDWIELTPPELREADAQPVADLFATGRHLPFEKEYLRKDGSPVPVLVASAFNEGSRNEGVAFVVDISAQKRAEREAKERSDEIVSIFETMTDAFFALDGDWRFTFVNAETERLLFRGRDQLLGKGIWDEFPQAENAAFGREYRRAVQEGVPVTFEEYYPPLEVWFEVRAFPSRTGAGLSVYFRNVTERRQREQERTKERDALITLQRRFMRDMVGSLTEGKFCLCLSADDLPKPLVLASEVVELTVPTMRLLRKKIRTTTAGLHFASERAQDIETAVGEAVMNAATHGGGGEGWVCADEAGTAVQVWIRDSGKGISEDALPHVLEKGMSTAGTLGHGFWLMLRTCDRVYLLTGKNGTTLVLEMGKNAPEPAWLQSV